MAEPTILGTADQPVSLDPRELLTDMRLFGLDEVPTALNLADRFCVPPFTVLNSREGWWQERKRQWYNLGLRSAKGRKDDLIGGTSTERTQVEEGLTKSRAGAYGAQGTTGADGKLTYQITTGATSIFDPVLCELAYRWFCPEGGHILDPFAGGSVRGLVAAVTGRHYIGIDLSADQVDANWEQEEDFRTRGIYRPELAPEWIIGNSLHVLPNIEPATSDYVYTCPPYYDLEQYSDDPEDLSNLPWPEFEEVYSTIIGRACATLRNNRFAGIVVGEIRDKKTGRFRDLVGLTIRAFEDAGCHYYNDAVLINAVGSLPIRAGKIFVASRKLGRSHQMFLTFVKGDDKIAAETCDPKVMDFLRQEDEPIPDGEEADLTELVHG